MGVVAYFALSRTTGLAPDTCWNRLTDWPRHGNRVPFTTVAALGGSGRAVGDVIVARTALGPLGFDDPMQIVAFSAPTPDRDGVCRLEKRGRIVRGWAELRVRPGERSGGGAEVIWSEEIAVMGVPRVLDPVTERVARVVFGRALDGLLTG